MKLVHGTAYAMPSILKKAPLVSVIIPSYNTARYLRDAIESVLKQTHPRVEIVVVNDGSPDNTDEVVQPYLDRINYIKQENRGLSAARNVGFRASHGEFVCFLDADDILLPRKFERQLAKFEREPDLDVVISGYIDVEEDGETEIQITPKHWQRQVLDHFLNHESFPPHVPLISRRVLEEIALFPEDIDTLEFQEDWQLWLDLALNGVQFSSIPEATCKYRRRQSSHGALNPLKHLDGARRVVRWLQKHPKSLCYRKQIEQLAYIVEMERVARAWQVGRIDLAADILVTAVRQSPRFWQTPETFVRLFERSLTLRENIEWQRSRDISRFEQQIIGGILLLDMGKLDQVMMRHLFATAYLALADLAYGTNNHPKRRYAIGQALQYSARACISAQARASTVRGLLGPSLGGSFRRLMRIGLTDEKESVQA